VICLCSFQRIVDYVSLTFVASAGLGRPGVLAIYDEQIAGRHSHKIVAEALRERMICHTLRKVSLRQNLSLETPLAFRMPASPWLGLRQS
jgi:hypothetical protein